MGLTNTRQGWGSVARLLHWAMAVLILFQLAVGVYMVEVIGGDLIRRFELTQTHKSWGFVVFALGLIRILWRWVSPTPTPPAMPGWQKRASEASHVALYVLMIALPVSGWLMASASPLNDPDAYPLQVRNMVFGLFELPDPFQPGSKALDEALKLVHAGLAAALATILAVHALAALKHQFVDHDGLLRRMILGR